MHSREEDFGAVLHGRVVAGDLSTAEEMFGSLEGSGKVRPGSTCYNSMILGCIQRSRWEDAISWYDRMREKGVEPLSSTNSGLMLASFKTGGKTSTLDLLNKFVTTETRLSADNILVALKILMPELDGEQTFRGIRERIRSMVDAQKQSAEPLLALTGSIRAADLEDQKRQSGRSSSNSTSDNWRSVLTALIKLTEAGSPEK